MQKRERSMMVLAVILAFVVAGLFMPEATGAGELEPGDPPGPTMHTLEEIYKKLEQIKKMESCIHYLELGYRFVDLGDGTVLDAATCKVWLKDAGCFGPKDFWWGNYATVNLADGQCGLTDGSQPYDWRLPAKYELQGLGTYPPAASYEGEPPGEVTWTEPGSPFVNVLQPDFYRSQSEYAGDPTSSRVWDVRMTDGLTGPGYKEWLKYVWPVRVD